MTIKIPQIVEEPRILEGQAVKPTTGANKGSFWAKDIGAGQVEGYFVDESGNEIQITDGGALAISGTDVNVKISAADTTTGYLENKLVAGANITLTKQNAGANENIKIDAVGGAGGLGTEFVVVLPPGASIAARVIAAGGNPIVTVAGPVFVYDGADPAVDPALAAGLTPIDLVIDHSLVGGGSGLPYVTTVMAINSFIPGQTYRIDSTAPSSGRILANEPVRTQFAIVFFDSGDVPPADQAEIYVKII